MIFIKDSLEKTNTVYLEGGFGAILKKSVQYVYKKRIRCHLPTQTVLYNGVPAHVACLVDSIVPWQQTDITSYESSLIKGIHTQVQEDDTVVVVGRGWGVSTVAATKQTGERRHVITYEGGKESVEKVVDTVQLNGVEDCVSVQHAVVRDAVSLRGNGTDAKVVSPVELPECDVLPYSTQ